VGSARERERGGSGRLSVLLRAGREVFADVAAAMVSSDAALKCVYSVVDYNTVNYGVHLFALPVSLGLKEVVEEYGWPGGSGAAGGGAEFSVEVPVSELVEAGAPGAEYCARLCSGCKVKLSFSCPSDFGDYLLNLEMYFEDSREGEEGLRKLPISLKAYANIGGGRLGLDPEHLRTGVGDLVDIAKILEVGLRTPEAGALSLLDLAEWLASRSRDEWGDAAAGAAARAAAALSLVHAAAFHEVWRASRVRVGGLGYPAVEEVAEAVRRKALEVYSMVAEWASAGHADLPREVKEIEIGGRWTVGEVLDSAARVLNTSVGGAEGFVIYARADAERLLNQAIAVGAAARVATEVLASLSDPE